MAEIISSLETLTFRLAMRPDTIRRSTKASPIQLQCNYSSRRYSKPEATQLRDDALDEQTTNRIMLCATIITTKMMFQHVLRAHSPETWNSKAHCANKACHRMYTKSIANRSEEKNEITGRIQSTAVGVTVMRPQHIRLETEHQIHT